MPNCAGKIARAYEELNSIILKCLNNNRVICPDGFTGGEILAYSVIVDYMDLFHGRIPERYRERLQVELPEHIGACEHCGTIYRGLARGKHFVMM